MPQLSKVVRLNDVRTVVGLTSVDSRLFVLRSPSFKLIEVYDTTTFTLQQALNVAGLSDRYDGYIDNDLTSCVVNNCLYVSDYDNANVCKIELRGDNEVFKWRVEDNSRPTGLSINTACNLLVSCFNDKKLLEYTSSGSLVREIRLESMTRPQHAIQLTSDQFVVCTLNGIDGAMSGEDVIEVNSRGQVVVSYGNQLQSTIRPQFKSPRHLAVDKSNECIFVADRDNNRIVMLSRSLKFAREFQPSVDGRKLEEPYSLHLNQSNSHLYVNEYFGGCIFVFDIRRRF
jgi:DNA-binding beta-propeller fold protein YncE